MFDARQIKSALSNPDAAALYTLSRERGNGLTAGNQIANDYDKLQSHEFIAKYGDRQYQDMVALGVGGNEARRLASAKRTVPQHLADVGRDVIAGVAQTGAGLAQMGAQAIPGDAGDYVSAKIAEASSAIQESMNEAQTPEYQQRLFINSLRRELDSQDAKAAADRDESTGFVKTLRNIGREAFQANNRAFEDPFTVESGIAQGVGSLLTGGPTAKILERASAAAGKLIAPEVAAVGGVVARAGQEAVEKVSFPLAVAAMEGGSNANQAIQDVLGQVDLKDQPEYQRLVATGMSPDAARLRLAANAGSIAAAVSAPLAAVTGKLVEPIERAPFAHGSAGSLLADAGKEFIEESVQSGVGQFASNLGEKVSGANPNQDLSQGVGGAAFEGGVAGAGSPVVTKGPGLVLSKTAQAAGAALMYPVNKVLNAGEQQIAANDAESSVSSENLAPAMQAAAEQAPQVAEGLQTLAQETGANQKDADALIERVVQASQLSSVEEEMRGVPLSLVQDLVDFGKANNLPENKFTALHFMAEVAANDENTDEERIAAGTYVARTINDNKKLFEEDLPTLLQDMPHDREEYQQLNGYASIVNAIQQNPEIQNALNWVQEKMRMPEQDLSGVDFNTPQGQQIVEQAVNVAAAVPHAVDFKTVNAILSQADSGLISLSGDRLRALRSASALQNAGRLRAALNRVPEAGLIEQEAGDLQQEIEETPDPDQALKFVSRQIKETGGRKASHLSLSQHIAGINQAVTQGDLKTARTKAQRLYAFAQSRINKLGAVNQSIANGDGKDVSYQNWSGTDFYTDKKGVGVKAGSSGGQSFARSVYADARAVAQLSNDLAGIYPAFGLQQLSVPDLALDRPAAQATPIANADVDGNRGSSTPVASAPSQATTSRTIDDAQQEELPLPPAQPTRDFGGETSAVEADVPESTGKTEKSSSEQEDVPAAEVSNDVAAPAQTEQVAEPEESVATPEQASPAVDTIVDNGRIDLETQATNQEETKTVEPTLADRFPHLVQPAGKNMFHQAFRLPKTVKSRLLGLQDPLRAIWKMLGSEQELKAFIGKDIESYDLDASDARNFRDLLKLGAAALNVMTDSLKSKLDKKTLAKIKDGTLSIRSRDLRILNLLELDGSDNFQYNQELIQSAMIAGLDWALNIAERSSPLKVDEVAGILGVDVGTAADYLDEFNRGLSLTTAKRSLAERIQKFWGVQANRDGRKAFTAGIPEAVAAEMLEAFHEAGLIEIGVAKFPEIGPDKNFNRVWLDTRQPELQAFINNFDKTSTFFSDLALTDREGEGASIGSPITEVAQTQHRNPMVKLTKQNKRALANAQATPYRPNTVVFDFFQALGEERYVSMLVGHPYKTGDLDKTHKQMGLNKGHWKSLQGQMRSYVSSYRNVARQMTKVKAYAAKQGIPLEEAAVYYGHDINKLGRPQMRGLSNPQTDKGAREVFMSTGSTLDLAGNTDDMDFFLQTVGQGIGLKTEQDTRSTIVAKVLEKVFTEGGSFYPLVQELKAWVVAREDGKDLSIPASVDAQMQKLGLSQHGIHSLISVARYLHAEETNQDLSKFQTSNYLEADGKTNGPINALMLFTSGAFTPGWLKAVGKGGAFVGRLGQTLNSWGDKVDLYKDGANVTQVKLEELGQEIRSNGSPEAVEHFQTFIRLMKSLNANVKVNVSGEVTIERNLTKNPLTITIYGSGPRGIAGNIAGELVNEFYKKLSNAATELPSNELLQDLSALTSQSIRFSKKTQKFFVAGNVEQVGGDATTFEFSPEQFNTLRDNVHTMLVNPMVSAINEQVTQHVAPVKKALLEATQLQSIILKNMFVTEVAKRIALMKSNPEAYDYRDGEFLSQAELDIIMDNLKRFSPIINTGTQSYMLSGGETGDLFDTTTVDVDGKPIKVSAPEDFARTLKSRLSTPAFVNGPTTVGVGGVPTLTIGSGDAQMMMNFLSENQDAAKRVLHVFDGLNVPADQIENYSNLINQAVFQTWTSNTNPVRSVYDSFKAFMDAKPIESLFTGSENQQQLAALNEMTAVDLGRSKFTDEERIDAEGAQELMNRVLTKLGALADDTDIRRQVLAEMPFSIDQMAGGETPYQNEGKIKLPANASDEQIIDVMNKRYAEIQAEKATRAKRQPVIESQAANNSGATELRISDIAGLPALKEISDVQKEMLDASIESLKDSGYRIVYGNADQLDAWEREYNADLFVPGSNNQDFGRIYTAKKLIVIRNMTAETLVHELVHASTFSKLANPSSKEEQAAVARIEGLMQEWIDETYPTIEDQATDDAFEVASSVVDTLLAKRNRLGAMSEFMAYVLSNQDLANQAAKTKVTNPVLRIIGDALDAIKALIFGKTKVTAPAEDLLSNLRFNARILMGPQTQVEGLKQDFADTVLHQSATFGSNDRLTQLREDFNQKIVSWINDAEIGQTNAATRKAARDLRQIDADDAKQSAHDVASEFALHFPDLGDMQAFSTFHMIQQALMTEARLNTNSVARTEELYRHVIDKLTVEDFMEDEDLNDPNDRLQAQDKLNALNGTFIKRTDKFGRSSLMSSFLALALTSDGFRKILSEMDVPASEKNTDGTMDARLENWATAGIDRMSLYLAGEKGSNVRDALDSLTASMIENVGDQRSYIEQQSEGRFDKIERAVADKIQDVSDKIVKKAANLKAGSNSKAVRAAANVAIVAATIINESSAQEAALGVTAALNKHGGFYEIQALLNEVNGRTRENGPIYDMIAKVRAWVQQTRQQYRDELPVKLAKAFSKPVSKDQWTAMFKALGKTDIASLVQYHGIPTALELVTKPQRLAYEISQLERSIKALDSNRFDKLKEKSKQLGHFMMTGEQGPKLLRNAEAIARLLGERGQQIMAPSAQLVDSIDRLVSLYALQGLDEKSIEAMTNLVDGEMSGLDFVTNYLVGQRKEEMLKARTTDEALLNHYKGHIPSEAQQGGSLIIASDSEHGRLVSRGYKQIASYTGSSADRSLGKRSYYFAPVSGTAIFNQGVLQTVHQTASGVDPETGYTTGEIMAGRIDDAQTVQLINRQLSNQVETAENLLPVYDGTGKVIAFERAADPKMLQKLNRSTDLAKMIGVWRGRQVEELLAQESNKQLVDNLHSIWESDSKAGRANEYVNIAKLSSNQKADPILAEAARLIPNGTRDYIKQVFGRDEFWVRRDMLLDTFGARQASIGDLFTGKTRWNPSVTGRFEKLAMGMFGNRAYPTFVSIEKNIQEFVSTAKTRIVVKSVIVPAANAVSNMFQLIGRGVPVRHVIHGFGAKTTEINAYIKSRAREVDLEADLRAAEGKNNLVEIRKISNKIQSLKDGYKRMSIWPLIEAGEFSAISNGNVTAEDLALADGRWSDWIEQKARDLPAGFNTVARYALVTKDTALFQGLARAVQYGDFVAKAILYDDMVGRQKLSKTDALTKVGEPFVNYDRLSGRTMQYLDSIGLMWFYKYKIRIMKEAAYLLRHNPLRSLLMTAVPALPLIGDIGSPVSDNVLAIASDGKLGWSIGPNMGLHSFGLNPWLNLAR
ncbi:hypothetical protein [Mesorhizobium sp. M7A.F.Ca.CA.002.12.1.1]|uniref:hypothetical protein n=1 Tax=Mesorhizobium sp. M7A.F.Ca.CA.002.12.1.1 TaxID=2496735 RepID=UPI000FCA2B10|nr:hypothetical protein [Mesorhizobium sp. M7A.F.Ca.CA.002.12.1.1]RUX60170.1 hypothetical protein EN989_11175 [Mesorhizobium sp. M7A.F.Ca.CA.002.12.1.1]